MYFRPRMLYTFDRNIFKRNWSSINEGPLKKAGLLARTVERGLIRKDRSKSKRPSKAGRPPKSRAAGHPFRRIFSEVSRLETNVVIGHVGFSPRRPTPMEAHEFGRPIRIKHFVPPKNRRKIMNPVQRARVRKLFREGKIKQRKLPVVTEMVKMPERRFADPTIKRVAARLPALWANSVSSATVQS